MSSIARLHYIMKFSLLIIAIKSKGLLTTLWGGMGKKVKFNED